MFQVFCIKRSFLKITKIFFEDRLTKTVKILSQLRRCEVIFRKLFLRLSLTQDEFNMKWFQISMSTSVVMFLLNLEIVPKMHIVLHIFYINYLICIKITT